MSSTNSLIEDSLDADTPTGYVLNFKGLYASTQQAGYLTYYDLSDGDYEVDECADYCNKNEFCMAFNIWYERDPSVTAAAACPNPVSYRIFLYVFPTNILTLVEGSCYQCQVRSVRISRLKRLGHERWSIPWSGRLQWPRFPGRRCWQQWYVRFCNSSA